MTAIYKRELKAYFHSVIGQLFIAATLFMVGLYFTVYNLLAGYPYMAYAVSSVIFLFLITIPVLTMRILAEEKKQKTDQLIMTAPISIGQIVMGKFLALLTIFAIPVIIICFYPLILIQFGTVAMAESYVAILGFFLYGMTGIAIGIFVSSWTESAVIAAVLTFVILFITYVMSGICNLISSTGNLLTQILGYLDMVSRFDAFLYGTLDITAMVYFISLTFLMLFLTTQSIQKRRYSVSVKSLRFGAYSSGMILLGIAVVVIVNLCMGRLSGNLTKIDVTVDQLYSITDQTQQMLSTLEEEVTIYVIANENNCDTLVAQTLERYEDASGHIKVEYVDPAVNPKFHTQYTSESINSNTLIVVSDKRSKVINYNNLYETSIDYTTYSTTTTGYDGEGQITSAIAYVTGDDMPKAYLITGHGELALEASFTDAIEKANIEYEEISLINYEKLPEDAECIIINAPTSDYSEEDAAKVLEYMKNGGKAIVMATWTGETMNNFESILEAYGIRLVEGVVVEGSSNNYYQYPMYLIPEVEYDTLTEDIYGSYNIFIQIGRGLKTNENADENVEITTLLSTSEDAYSKVNIEESYEKTENDIAGPFALGMKAVKEEEGGESTLLVYASEGLFTESSNQMVSGANLRLFSNSLSSLVEYTDNISIPVKSYEVSYLSMTQAQITLLALFTVIVLPAAVLLSGIIIWWRRRRA